MPIARPVGLALALACALALLWRAAPLSAADHVVNDCSSDAELRADLEAVLASGGGALTFACGAAPVTIALTDGAAPDGVLPAITAAVTVDGGSLVTLSGANSSRIFTVAGSGSLTLRRLRLTRGFNNGDGGAIRADGALTIAQSVFTANEAVNGSGGAIVAYGPLTITDSEFAGNKAVNGGAIYPRHGSVVRITGSRFHENQTERFATGRGGAMLLWDGPRVTVEASRFYSNSATYGAGIYVTANSALTVTTSTFHNNESEFGGTAVYNDGTTLVTRSLVTANRSGAMGTGGAFFNDEALTLINVTLHGNGGTGIYNWGPSVRLFYSTITGQQGYGFQGGYGILSSAGVVQMQNSIIAGNALNCSIYSQGTAQSLGRNISDGDNCGLSVTTQDKPNTDPMLGPLADNGGPTLTRMPLEGSPAIDEAQGIAGVTTDQRGVSRPQGDAPDIGAVEVTNEQRIYLPFVAT